MKAFHNFVVRKADNKIIYTNCSVIKCREYLASLPNPADYYLAWKFFTA